MTSLDLSVKQRDKDYEEWGRYSGYSKPEDVSYHSLSMQQEYFSPNRETPQDPRVIINDADRVLEQMEGSTTNLRHSINEICAWHDLIDDLRIQASRYCSSLKSMDAKYEELKNKLKDKMRTFAEDGSYDAFPEMLTNYEERYLEASQHLKNVLDLSYYFSSDQLMLSKLLEGNNFPIMQEKISHFDSMHARFAKRLIEAESQLSLLQDSLSEVSAAKTTTNGRSRATKTISNPVTNGINQMLLTSINTIFNPIIKSVEKMVGKVEKEEEEEAQLDAQILIKNFPNSCLGKLPSDKVISKINEIERQKEYDVLSRTPLSSHSGRKGCIEEICSPSLREYDYTHDKVDLFTGDARRDEFQNLHLTNEWNISNESLYEQEDTISEVRSSGTESWLENRVEGKERAKRSKKSNQNKTKTKRKSVSPNDSQNKSSSDKKRQKKNRTQRDLEEEEEISTSESIDRNERPAKGKAREAAPLSFSHASKRGSDSGISEHRNTAKREEPAVVDLT